jgi:hypothetical protein
MFVHLPVKTGGYEDTAGELSQALCGTIYSGMAGHLRD